MADAYTDEQRARTIGRDAATAKWETIHHWTAPSSSVSKCHRSPAAHICAARAQRADDHRRQPRSFANMPPAFSGHRLRRPS
ncbi:hypothetical protein ACSNOH_18575 [Streptomyces sp. URMC 127]